MNRDIIREIEFLKETIMNYKGEKVVRIMEVCGTHTMSIAKFGIRQMMPQNVKLVSGPGCPVCVTSTDDIDLMINASTIPGAIITTFGDMLKVPGSNSTLSGSRASGADVRVVYSVYDALEIAKKNKNREVIFLSVGFETTCPSVAEAIKKAYEENIKNFSVLCLNKTMPNALNALMSKEKIKVDALLLPGHVSTIIGVKPYEFLKRYNVCSVITGFELRDILLAISYILKHVGEPLIKNEYTRLVKDDGNKSALELINEVYDVCDATWRGLGQIKASGLRIKDKYSDFDTEKKFNLPRLTGKYDAIKIRGCRCGDVITGLIEPKECKLFGKECTIENPVGPCMVTSEGSCGIWYTHREKA